MSAREKAAEVLATHRAYGEYDGGIEECGCKATPPAQAFEEDFGDLLWHEAHVADALDEAGLLTNTFGFITQRARAEKAERERDQWKRTADERSSTALAERVVRAEAALARVEALADEWQGEARAHREAAIRDADIERDWIAGAIEHRLTYLRRALQGDDA